MPILKNARHEAFAQLVAAGKTNETQAYCQVYGGKNDPEKGHTRGSASVLRAKPIVAARIKELQAMAEQEAVFSARDVLLELKKLVHFDPRKMFDEDGKPIPIHKLDDDTAAAVSGLDLMEQYEIVDGEKVFIGYVKKYKLADKHKAVETAMKHLGLLNTKVDVGLEASLEALVLGSIIKKEA